MSYLIFLLCLSFIFVTAYGLDCYQCQTLAGTGCDDPFNRNIPESEAFLGECDDESYCVKYKTVVKLRDSGYINGWERHSVVVTRACEPRQGKTEQCTGWQNNGGITIKCWCDSDGCNPAPSLVPSRTLTLLALLATVTVLLRRLL